MKKQNPGACALSNLGAGSRAKVAKVDGSDAERARLNALGLTPQADIEVIDCRCGRQVVKVRGCSLILDDETAGHVTCSLETLKQSRVAE